MNCELKRPSTTKHSEALQPTICGKPDPGIYAYQVVQRGQGLAELQVPGVEICPACAKILESEARNDKTA